MLKKNLFSRELITSLVIYNLAAFILIKFVFYCEIDPDGISYISIALKYLKGDPNAINAYWSPLFSWLIVPLLKIGVDPIYALKYVNIILGNIFLALIVIFANLFHLPKYIRIYQSILSIPLIVYFTLYYSTPDFLLLVIGLIYALIFLKNKKFGDARDYFCLGIIISLGFFAKAYFLFFFFVHFLALIALNLKGFRKKISTPQLLYLFAPVIILVGSWVGLVSFRYNRFIASSAGEYNYKIAGPNYREFPMFTIGFLDPPNDSAVSAWEDPTDHPLADWSPLSSTKDFMYQLKIIFKNLSRFLNIISEYSVFSVTLITIVILQFFSQKRKIINDDILFSLLIIFCWIIGYIFISIESRYLWIIDILLMFIGLKYLSESILKKFNKRVRIFIVIMFLLSFQVMPIKQLARPITVRKDAYDISQSLKKMGVKGRIASNGNWDTSLFISYYLDSQYFGSDSKNPPEMIEKQLLEHKIDYYFEWGKENVKENQFYQQIAYFRENELVIYRRK